MSFLASLAQQLLTTYGTNLSQVTVVFPNKRASLFLNEELARLSDSPIWAPAYTTISDLFRSLSSREVADPIKLICDLHKSFVQCTGIDESLDHFYGWGQILLADFDDVDKHLAPADKVFANLRDLHELDDDSYLTQEQRDIIRKFFSHFNEDHTTELKQRFLSLWSHLYDIYLDFNARLVSQNLAYEGSLYRQIIENLRGNEVEDCVIPFKNVLARRSSSCGMFFERNNTVLLSPAKYVFAGFNLLHPVEQALIDALGDKAQVIHDTDEETPKDVSIISATTNDIQARYIATWLKEKDRIAAGSKTAIVLADESLLQTVIHCLPPEVTKVNITTGYPLSQTAAAQGGARTHGEGELQTPASVESPLEQEAQFQMYTIQNRLQTLVESGDLDVSDATLQRLMTQIIASTSIPFHGEPIEGIQIMGVLETRNLDFDHVLLLSCNEGNLPKGVNDTSFIPYSIRKAYGLTTIDHKVSIYHNYFRRLLQRAGDVTLLYNNATNDGKTGEMSRFMLQMMVEGRHPITFKTLQAGQTPVLRNPQPVEKTEAVMQKLQSIDTLSPSALSRYLRCPLQFFYHYIAGLDEYEEEDERIDNRLFGNIFHKAAQILYTPLTGDRAFSKEMFCSLNDVDIARAVDQAIKIELFHIEDPMAKMPPLNGLQLINREVIIRYLHQLLELDRQFAPFTILALETSLVSGQFLPFEKFLRPFGSKRQSRALARRASSCGMFSERKDLSTVKVGGVVDRIDLITLPDGTERIRIIDYKTGSGRLKPLPDVAAIFDPANIKLHSDYYLQSILYSCLLQEKTILNQKEEQNLSFESNPHEEVFRDCKIFGTNIESQIEQQSEERNTKCCLSEASSLSGSENITVGLRDRTLEKGRSCSSSVEEPHKTMPPVSPCLLFIQHAGVDDYDPTLIIGQAPVTDVREIKDEFMERLNKLIEEIFDPAIPFTPTEEGTRCKSCPFSSICGI